MAPALKDPWLELPPGRLIDLPGRRSVFVRDTGGRPGTPVLVMIHGLMLTSDLNWFSAFEPLGREFRVVAMDLPGHGRSPAKGSRLRLTECADDVAALATVLGLDRVIPVGYSMGGLIAQLVWQRHRSLVAGLVLCSTARNFRGTSLEQLTYLTLPGLATAISLNPFLRLLGSGAAGAAVLGYIDDPRLRTWARDELERSSLATATAALDEVSWFTSHQWIREVNVPTAVLVTTRDQVVPASRQRRLAEAIPAAAVYELAGDHGVCVNAPGRFGAALVAACETVAGVGPRTSRLPPTGSFVG